MREIVEKGEEVWTTESKTKISSLYSRSISQNASCSMKHSELLRVENLEVRTPIHSLSRVCQQRQHCTIDTVEQAVSCGNFSNYQGGDLNEFFGCDVFAPKRISEVCLVNDHYILVKIPEISKPKNPQQQSFPNEEDIKATTTTTTTQSKTKYTQYLRCGNTRSSRISPTSETLRTEKCGNESTWNSNGCVQEIFKSRTTIQGNLRKFQPAKAKAEEVEKIDNSISPQYKDSETSPLRSYSPTRTPLQTSLNYKVNLQTHGRFETSQGDGIMNNPRQHNLPRPRLFGSSLRCFLKSFRNRPTAARISPKINKKINAVVYKTFFVSWIKAGKKSCCSHCRDKISLRRTQSAIF